MTPEELDDFITSIVEQRIAESVGMMVGRVEELEKKFDADVSTLNAVMPHVLQMLEAMPGEDVFKALRERDGVILEALAKVMIGREGTEAARIYRQALIDEIFLLIQGNDGTDDKTRNHIAMSNRIVEFLLGEA